MRTDCHKNSSRVLLGFAWYAADDPVQPIHEYTFPIPSSMPLPRREDFKKYEKRRRPPVNKPQPKHPDNGHVDDYA